jgi:hypothetical protein
VTAEHSLAEPGREALDLPLVRSVMSTSELFGT